MILFLAWIHKNTKAKMFIIKFAISFQCQLNIDDIYIALSDLVFYVTRVVKSLKIWLAKGAKVKKNSMLVSYNMTRKI